MNKIKLTLIAIVGLLGVMAIVPQPALAACGANSSAKECIQEGVNVSGGANNTNSKSLESRIKDIVNIILFITGALAVIMIIVGGIRYVVSAGNSSSVTGAKNTILYAVVGLVIAILAYAIVNFVVTSL